MTMLSSAQHVLLKHALAPTASVALSLALSTSLLQAGPGPIQPAPCTLRARACGGLPPAGAFQREGRTRAWAPFPAATATGSGGYIEERSEEETPVPALAPGPQQAFPLRSGGGPSPSPRPPAGALEETASSIEKIERQAKASIEKLRHILYTVKTRAPRGSAGPSEGVWGWDEEGEEMGIGDVGQSQPPTCKGGSDTGPGDPDGPSEEGRGLRGAAVPQHEAYVRHDAVTCTRSTVRFDKGTNTGVVTLVATVRADSALQGGGALVSERSVILAAQALARVCAALEEQASEAIAAAQDPAGQTEGRIQHDCLLEQLRSGEVAEAVEVKKGYGATPFRVVYVVKLVQTDGAASHALFKPFLPGDAHRYSGALPEYVAYELGQLLETDMVPPAVMRRDMQVGGNFFPLGTLIQHVPDVRKLTRRGPQEWGAGFVSNVHILDALVGTAPRERRFFMEGLHWVRRGKRRPMVLDHPAGPTATQKLHAMWTPGAMQRPSGKSRTGRWPPSRAWTQPYYKRSLAHTCRRMRWRGYYKDGTTWSTFASPSSNPAPRSWSNPPNNVYAGGRIL